MSKFEIGKIVDGIATKWDPKIQKLIVQIPSFSEYEEDSFGFVYPEDLTMYEDLTDELMYSKAAAYCVGIKLRYLVIGLTDKGPVLSRKELGEQTLNAIENNPNMQFYGVITNINKTNIFVDIDGVTGICPAKEATYAFVKDLSVIFNSGDRIRFKAISRNGEKKLYLSHTSCLKPKTEIIANYEIGTIIQATLLGRVNPSGDTCQKYSWFAIVDGVCPGIVEVPYDLIAQYGDHVTVCIKKHTAKGFRAAFVKK